MIFPCLNSSRIYVVNVEDRHKLFLHKVGTGMEEGDGLYRRLSHRNWQNSMYRFPTRRIVSLTGISWSRPSETTTTR